MPTTDLDGDGRDDIIWRNLDTGVVTNWLGQPNGGFIYNAASGDDPWAAGDFVGVGDFNGDGRSDTLWRNDVGELYLATTEPGGAFHFYWNSELVAQESPRTGTSSERATSTQTDATISCGAMIGARC